MRKILLTLLTLALLCVGALADGETAAAETYDNGRPYYIMVNRTCNTVTIYGLGEDGRYTEPVRAMVCSTGRPGRLTPRGTYSVTSNRKRWCLMVDGSYGQYSTQFNGHILFHSVCYSRRDPASLMTEEYNLLGTNVSLGCVRLQVDDARWIYENCAPGTKVTVYEGEDPGPLGKPAPLVAEITEDLENGWEPTDPDEANPWRARFVRSLELDESAVTVTAGEKRSLTAVTGPEGAFLPEVVWTSSNPSVATVDADGGVIGMGVGSARITATCGELEASCEVAVREKLLPLSDLTPGEWYYSHVRYVYERNIMTGTAGQAFLPEETVSRAAAVQSLYHLALSRQDWEEPEPEEETPPDAPWYDGVKDRLRELAHALLERMGGESRAPVEPEAPPPWYAAALDWALETGVVEAEEDERFSPDDAVTWRELAGMLYRLSDAMENAESAESGGDGGETADAADSRTAAVTPGTAVRWAAEQGLSDEGAEPLRPGYAVTRADLAAVIHRYDARYDDE